MRHIAGGVPMSLINEIIGGDKREDMWRSLSVANSRWRPGTTRERMQYGFELAEELRSEHLAFLRFSELTDGFGSAEKAGYLTEMFGAGKYELSFGDEDEVFKSKLNEHNLEMYQMRVSENCSRFIFLPQGLSIEEEINLVREFTGVTMLVVVDVVLPLSPVIATPATALMVSPFSPLTASPIEPETEQFPPDRVSFFRPFSDKECAEIAEELEKLAPP